MNKRFIQTKFFSFVFVKYQLGGREPRIVASEPSTSNQNQNTTSNRRSRRSTRKSYIDYLTTGQLSSR